MTLPDDAFRLGVSLANGTSYTNDHFLPDRTKDEKWLVLVGRPSLAASRWRARRPAPPSYFHINAPSNRNFS